MFYQILYLDICLQICTELRCQWRYQIFSYTGHMSFIMITRILYTSSLQAIVQRLQNKVWIQIRLYRHCYQSFSILQLLGFHVPTLLAIVVSILQLLGFHVHFLLYLARVRFCASVVYWYSFVRAQSYSLAQIDRVTYVT